MMHTNHKGWAEDGYLQGPIPARKDERMTDPTRPEAVDIEELERLYAVIVNAVGTRHLSYDGTDVLSKKVRLGRLTYRQMNEMFVKVFNAFPAIRDRLKAQDAELVALRREVEASRKYDLIRNQYMSGIHSDHHTVNRLEREWSDARAATDAARGGAK